MGAESSSLPPSSVSEKWESLTGTCRCWFGVSSGKVSVAKSRWGVNEHGSTERGKGRE